MTSDTLLFAKMSTDHINFQPVLSITLTTGRSDHELATCDRTITNYYYDNATNPTTLDDNDAHNIDQ